MKIMNMVKKSLSLLLVFAFFFLLIPVPAQAAEGDACVHVFEETVTPPTCELEGYTTFTCTLCGQSETKNFVDPLGHDFVAGKVVEPNCVTDGYTVYTCSLCGGVEYRDEVSATGKHNYVVTERVEATCTEDGYEVYTCTNCPANYTETLLAGCPYIIGYIEPNCEDCGVATYYCPVCGDYWEDIDYGTPALGHSYVSTVIAPTCVEDGYTMHTCSVCYNTYCSDFVSAAGHTYTSRVTAPTCDAAGYTTHTCTGCGHSYTSDSVKALGHDYTVRLINGNAYYTCKTCGHTRVMTSGSSTTYARVTKFAAGDSYVIAVYDGRTAYALSHVGNKISAVEITISGGKVTSNVSDDMLWKYTAGKLSYQSGGKTYFLYAPKSTGYVTLSVSTTSYSFVSYSSNKLLVGSYYLKFNNGTIKGYRSGGTTYLMEKQ